MPADQQIASASAFGGHVGSAAPSARRAFEF